MIDKYGCVPVIGVPCEQGEDHFDSLKTVLQEQNIIRGPDIPLVKKLKENNKFLAEENKKNMPHIAYWVKDNESKDAKCSICGTYASYQIVNGKLVYEPFCAHCGSKVVANKEEAEYLKKLQETRLRIHNMNTEPVTTLVHNTGPVVPFDDAVFLF